MSVRNGKYFIFSPILWMLCLFLISLQLPAQTPFFRTIRLAESLHSTTINYLYQDHNGVIWLGSGQGLFRFNGRDFIAIPVSGNTANLPVSAIFMDTANVLWVGTKNGSIWQLDRDSLRAFSPQEGLPQKAITGFAADGRGNFWFSTYGEGLYYFNGKYLYNLNTDDGLSDNFCYRIIPDKYGRIWAATDEGISVCYATEKMKKVEKITTERGLPDNIVLSIVPGQKGLMWVGMEDGGVCAVESSTLKIVQSTVTKAWEFGPIKDILVFNDILWLTSEKDGILEINPFNQSQPKSYYSGENFDFPKVNSLMADNQGNCWITTNNELIISAGPGFKNMKTLANKPLGHIQSILSDHQGGIWYSNEGKLFRFSPGEIGMKSPKQIQLPLIHHTHIISLYEDTMGFIWAGTFGNGLLRVNPVTGRVRLILDKEGLTNGNILSITGKGNEIWLATLGGAYHCKLLSDAWKDEATLKFVNYNQENSPGNNYIYSVFIDSKDRVWFGTDGKGISVLQKGHFTSYGEANGLKSKVVYSITEDQDGNIWFTTSNAGVYRFDGKRFTNYSTANGLSDNQISCIAADHQHHILFANNHGIDILDVRNGSFVYYGSELGLESIDPDLNVISGNGSDLFWIGTRNGMIRLEIPRDSRPRHPALMLNKVAVFLGNENFKDQHEFSYKQNHLSFFFNAAWYIAPDMVTYQIKLEGYDLDWINTKDNLATYSSLPPGEYTFKVRAALKGNYLDSVLLSYSFIIHKPYWKTWWFIMLAVLFVLAMIFLIVRIREARIKQKEISERENLLFQFQTLRSQVNPHFLFNSFSTLMSVIDEDKDLAIEYVQNLSQFFRNILEYRDMDLITLQEELKLIETYRYLQHQRYGDNFYLEIAVPEKYLLTLIPPLTLQMLLENAIKHNVVSAEKKLVVTIKCDEQYLSVCNTLQRKKLVESSTGIGLINIQNRYKLLGYHEIVIQETPSEFIIRLPLIQKS